MLIGEYQHTIDTKGRAIVPSKFREELGLRFILTKGLDGCLYAYSLEEWKNVEKTIKELPTGSKDVRAFVRFFFAGAVECDVDKQGRFNVPQNLREYAKIDKEIVTIGALSKVEIWSKQRWEEYALENQNCDEIVEKLTDFTI